MVPFYTKIVNWSYVSTFTHCTTLLQERLFSAYFSDFVPDIGHTAEIFCVWLSKNESLHTIAVGYINVYWPFNSANINEIAIRKTNMQYSLYNNWQGKTKILGQNPWRIVTFSSTNITSSSLESNSSYLEQEPERDS